MGRSGFESVSRSSRADPMRTLCLGGSTEGARPESQPTSPHPRRSFLSWPRLHTAQQSARERTDCREATRKTIYHDNSNL